MTHKSESFIVTKDEKKWNLVDMETLNSFKVDKESKQIKNKTWNYGQFLKPIYDPYLLLNLLETNTYHAQCCGEIARTASGSGYTINPISIETDIDESERLKVLDTLNKISNLNEQLYRRQYDVHSIGYGAIEIIREGKSNSRFIDLKHIPSQHLRRHQDGIRIKQQIHFKSVWFYLYGQNYDSNGNPFDVKASTGEIVKYNSLSPQKRANEILWAMKYTPKSQFYGLPSIISAIPTIQGDLSRSKYNKSFFANYGVPSFAVTIAGDFKDYDKRPGDVGFDHTQTLKYKITQQLREVMENPYSAITILIPSEGEEGKVDIKLQPLTVESKEASFRLYRKDNRDEVLTAHKVPPYQIGINEPGLLGAINILESNRIYKNTVIEPLQANDEYDINLLLSNEIGLNTCRFALQEIDIHDYSSDWTIAKEMLDRAVMRPIDAQSYFGERFGLTPDIDNPHLKEYYLKGIPLKSIWKDIPTTEKFK